MDKKKKKLKKRKAPARKPKPATKQAIAEGDRHGRKDAGYAGNLPQGSEPESESELLAGSVDETDEEDRGGEGEEEGDQSERD